MKRKVPLPLNEAQERHIAIALANLERHLAGLRERLEHGPRDLRLTHYEDGLDANEAAALLPAVREAETQLRTIADQLRLPAMNEPVRRSLVVALELAGINLYECRPQHGLAGYGVVAPTTAEYLDREIPKLDAAVQTVIARLQQGSGDVPD